MITITTKHPGEGENIQLWNRGKQISWHVNFYDKTLETTEAGILTKRSHDKCFSHFPNCFFDSHISFKINDLTQDYLLCLLICISQLLVNLPKLVVMHCYPSVWLSEAVLTQSIRKNMVSTQFSQKWEYNGIKQMSYTIT